MVSRVKGKELEIAFSEQVREGKRDHIDTKSLLWGYES